MERHERPAFQAQLLDITHEAVIAFDVDERIVYWNRGAETTYGWSEPEVLGRAAEEVLRPDGGSLPGEEREERLGRLRRQETLSGGSRVRRKDGTPIEVEYNARAYFDDEGRLAGYVSVHRDVTERRRAERVLREREARFAALIEASPDPRPHAGRSGARPAQPAQHHRAHGAGALRRWPPRSRARGHRALRRRDGSPHSRPAGRIPAGGRVRDRRAGARRSRRTLP